MTTVIVGAELSEMNAAKLTTDEGSTGGDHTDENDSDAGDYTAVDGVVGGDTLADDDQVLVAMLPESSRRCSTANDDRGTTVAAN